MHRQRHRSAYAVIGLRRDRHLTSGHRLHDARLRDPRHSGVGADEARDGVRIRAVRASLQFHLLARAQLRDGATHIHPRGLGIDRHADRGALAILRLYAHGCRTRRNARDRSILRHPHHVRIAALPRQNGIAVLRDRVAQLLRLVDAHRRRLAAELDARGRLVHAHLAAGALAVVRRHLDGRRARAQRLDVARRVHAHDLLVAGCVRQPRHRALRQNRRQTARLLYTHDQVLRRQRHALRRGIDAHQHLRGMAVVRCRRDGRLANARGDQRAVVLRPRHLIIGGGAAELGICSAFPLERVLQLLANAQAHLGVCDLDPGGRFLHGQLAGGLFPVVGFGRDGSLARANGGDQSVGVHRGHLLVAGGPGDRRAGIRRNRIAELEDISRAQRMLRLAQHNLRGCLHHRDGAFGLPTVRRRDDDLRRARGHALDIALRVHGADFLVPRGKAQRRFRRKHRRIQRQRLTDAHRQRRHADFAERLNHLIDSVEKLHVLRRNRFRHLRLLHGLRIRRLCRFLRSGSLRSPVLRRGCRHFIRLRRSLRGRFRLRLSDGLHRCRYLHRSSGLRFLRQGHRRTSQHQRHQQQQRSLHFLLHWTFSASLSMGRTMQPAS